MQTKKLVFNSDDFGYSEAFNLGIKKGYLSGILTSTCLLANGEAFDAAMNEILPEIKDIGLGAHLNIIEGKSLTNGNLLCDSNSNFKNDFVAILSNSYNKKFLEQVEAEFRAQIEKILEHTQIDHLNSHVHVHAIPEIFKITCKLAEEYGIKYIRTQHEVPYVVPSLLKHFSVKYPVNLIKFSLLNGFSLMNTRTIKKYNLKTNNYALGITYTGYMDEKTIKYGLQAIQSDDCICEILIHPCYFKSDNIEKPFNYGEYLITQSATIKDEIKKMGWVFTNYKKLSQES